MRNSCEDVVENMHLLTEILLWLPTKQVLRCKCVCKKCLALISAPQLCHSHTLRLCHNPYPCHLLLQKYDDMSFRKACIVPFISSVDDACRYPKRTFRLDFQNVFYDPFYSIMQSCNGLVLWNVSPTSCFLEREEYFQRSSFHVCNPATGHCVRLNYPGDKFHPLSSTLYLVFEPLKSLYYKVILLGQVKGRRSFYDKWGGVAELIHPKFEISIYSSETGCWSENGVCICTPLKISAEDGIYCNGSIHRYNRAGNLVYFDVRRLCLNKLSGPASVDWNDVCVWYFRESGGHLHLFYPTVEKEDYSEWVVRYHVHLNLMAQGDASSWHVNPSRFVLCYLPTK